MAKRKRRVIHKPPPQGGGASSGPGDGESGEAGGEGEGGENKPPPKGLPPEKITSLAEMLANTLGDESIDTLK